MKKFLIVVIALSAITDSCSRKWQHKRQQINSNEIEDAFLTVPEIVRKYGYPCEIHTITTSDGYIINIYRIPYGKNSSTKIKPLVLLNHGLTTNSASWIMMGPTYALDGAYMLTKMNNGPGRDKRLNLVGSEIAGYKLVDTGFDVWMVNVRGTIYSRKHIRLDPDKDDEEYWNFSWHEMAIIDTAETIDYILDITKQKQISYIGHSQGSTCLYVLLSEKPEYNRKLNIGIGFGVTAFLLDFPHVVTKFLETNADFLQELPQALEFYEVPVPNAYYKQMLYNLCNEKSKYHHLCLSIAMWLYGCSSEQRNVTLLSTILGHIPGGNSVWQPLHYLQLIMSGKFRQYDYGRKENLRHYGSLSPPDYNLQNIYTPQYLFHTMDDKIISTKAVNTLYRQLSNATLILISEKRFCHIDFVIEPKALECLYPQVIELLWKHN